MGDSVGKMDGLDEGRSVGPVVDRLLGEPVGGLVRFSLLEGSDDG